MADNIPPAGSKQSISINLQDLTFVMNIFSEDALIFLAGLSNDQYHNDRANQELSRSVDRVARLRMDLIELERKLA